MINAEWKVAQVVRVQPAVQQEFQSGIYPSVTVEVKLKGSFKLKGVLLKRVK